MSKRKTLRRQVGDLRVALHVIHSGWEACPWCGQRKHPAAHCNCKGWANAAGKIPRLLNDRIDEAQP